MSLRKSTPCILVRVFGWQTPKICRLASRDKLQQALHRCTRHLVNKLCLYRHNVLWCTNNSLRVSTMSSWFSQHYEIKMSMAILTSLRFVPECRSLMQDNRWSSLLSNLNRFSLNIVIAFKIWQACRNKIHLIVNTAKTSISDLLQCHDFSSALQKYDQCNKINDLNLVIIIDSYWLTRSFQSLFFGKISHLKKKCFPPRIIDLWRQWKETF